VGDRRQHRHHAGEEMSATLPAFRGRHEGETIIVCGCGTSLRTLVEPQRHLTIGVNDVGRLFDPTYLVVVNPPSQLRNGRFAYVQQSNAQALFTQLDLGPVRPPVVRFKLGQYGGTEIGAGGELHYTQNSPYVAVCLAAYMGARRIGLIGVDLTDDHFFARTGRHSLAGRLREIDAQYGQLAAALGKRGIELVNLSTTSRLVSLPRAPIEPGGEPAPASIPTPPAVPEARPRRVFFVNYRFLSCGDVFRDGLRHGAEELGIPSAEAFWDDPGLPARVKAFDPDLLFVVHGRNFVRKWGRTFAGRRSAVWLLDEPYEVDDTSRYSASFTHVFVNDPATLSRHRAVHYLPVGHDPRVHYPGTGERRYAVGFVGGPNAARERMLGALAQRGRIDYVVGGPWRTGALGRICLSRNLPAAETAALYRATKIVVNVFRDVHHFNRGGIAAVSLNPRVYEALACGALVVSEGRPEIEKLVPEMPTFTSASELVNVIEDLLADAGRREELRAACARRLSGATYAARLRTVMELTREDGRPEVEVVRASRPPASTLVSAEPDESEGGLPGATWAFCEPVERGGSDGALVLRKAPDAAAGSERGLATRAAYEEVDLSFEVWITPGTSFIAKVHQAGPLDQASNSYHLFCEGPRAYLARHDHIFRWVDVPRGGWQRLRMTYGGQTLSFYRGDLLVCRIRDRHLVRGHAFLGLKGGEVRLRNVHVGPLAAAADAPEAFGPERPLYHPAPAREGRPRVTIVTTVYDRTDCLRRCLRSVKALTFKDYEHIVLSDHPPEPVVDEIARIVREEDDGRISYFDLPTRFNNWGIAPAAAGLRRSRGEFVCFLSDDNGYLPDHLATLVDVLDGDPGLGFAYSSCLYGGRAILRHPVPRPGGIDLGQPLFRRELFSRHLDDGLPFNVVAWDWALIDAFIRRGVRWKHVDRPSFVFRLAAYPQLVPA
jgi:hypothetical protein